MPDVDYDKIARQHGGKVVEDVDYDALAAEFGGKVVQPELGMDPPTTRPDKRAFTQEDFNRHMLPDPKVVAAAAPIAAGIALGPVAGAAVRALPIGGALGAVGRWAAANPAGAGAISGAIPGVLRGDLREAAIGAGAGAIGIPAIGGAAGVATTLARKALGPAAKAAKAASTATKAATKAPIAKVAPIVDRGAAVAAKHAATVQFAKEIAAKNPKVGEKIWLLLDKAGNPVRHITPDQAGAAARRGEATTWIRNLWR